MCQCAAFTNHRKQMLCDYLLFCNIKFFNQFFIKDNYICDIII